MWNALTYTEQAVNNIACDRSGDNLFLTVNLNSLCYSLTKLNGAINWYVIPTINGQSSQYFYGNEGLSAFPSISRVTASIRQGFDPSLVDPDPSHFNFGTAWTIPQSPYMIQFGRGTSLFQLVPGTTAPNFAYDTQIRKVSPIDGSIAWEVLISNVTFLVGAVSPSGVLWTGPAPARDIHHVNTGAFNIQKYASSDGSLVSDSPVVGYPPVGDGTTVRQTVIEGDSVIYSCGLLLYGAKKFVCVISGGAVTQEIIVDDPVNSDWPRIAVDYQGGIFLAYSGSVYKFSPDGEQLWSFSHGAVINTLDVDDEGNLYLGGAEAPA